MKVFYQVHEPGRGWFRIFGIGLSWRDDRFEKSFSERYGYHKGLRIGKLTFHFLGW